VAQDFDESARATTSIDGEQEVSLLSIAIVVSDNLRLLVIGSLSAGLIALGATFLVAPTYTARTSFLPPNQQQISSASALAQLGAIAGVVSSASGLKNPADQYVALLKSQTIADRTVDRFNLLALYGKDLRQDAREELEDSTKITAGKDGLIVVEVEDRSAQRAAGIANFYVSELQVLLDRLALTEAQQRRVFFERQLTDTKTRLAEAERELTGSGVATGAVKANPEAAVGLLANLQAQIRAQEVQLASMRGYLTESSPELVRAHVALEALRKQLRDQEQANPEASAGGDYIERFRTFKYYETLFDLFARQYELAKVDEAREGALIQVVDVAVAPERKSKPKRALIAALTTFGAGVLLFVVALVRAAIRNGEASPSIAPKLSQLKLSLRRALGRG
jgi:tyrosine-protein kinase Etk/Wzc